MQHDNLIAAAMLCAAEPKATWYYLPAHLVDVSKGTTIVRDKNTRFRVYGPSLRIAFQQYDAFIERPH